MPYNCLTIVGFALRKMRVAFLLFLAGAADGFTSPSGWSSRLSPPPGGSTWLPPPPPQRAIPAAAARGGGGELAPEEIAVLSERLARVPAVRANLPAPFRQTICDVAVAAVVAEIESADDERGRVLLESAAQDPDALRARCARALVASANVPLLTEKQQLALADGALVVLLDEVREEVQK